MSDALHIYCDESGYTAHRHMVFGGITVPASARLAVTGRIRDWREAENMHGELKWTKVSSTKLPQYRSFVDLYFDLAVAEHMCFHSIVFDGRTVDYRTFHDNDRALAFDKFFYEFLLHRFGCLATTDDYRLCVFLDEKDRRTELEEFRRILNAGIRATFGRSCDVVVAAQHVDSHKCEVVQIADVLMGAVRYQYSGDDERPGAALSKVSLAAYIAERAGLASLRQGTSRDHPFFTIWPFAFRGTTKATP